MHLVCLVPISFGSSPAGTAVGCLVKAISADGVQTSPECCQVLARLRGKQLLAEVARGVRFIDGIKETAA